mgnify:FL=1
MQLFLDTANIDEIKEIAAWGVLDGVTTNPSLVAKEGVPFEKRVKEICKIVKGPVSAEVISTDVKGMLREARIYARWAKNIVVKVPLTPEGLQAVEVLKNEKIRTNVTLCFSANQALLAAKAGATFVSPFIGRLDDEGERGMTVVEEIVRVFKNYSFKTKVLVASVREPRQVTEAALAGADIATVPYTIFEKLVIHPLTDAGIKKFLADWKKSQKK